ncbi:hypothetical protein NPIL_548681, partial [Nephila pilipes]
VLAACAVTLVCVVPAKFNIGPSLTEILSKNKVKYRNDESREPPRKDEEQKRGEWIQFEVAPEKGRRTWGIEAYERIPKLGSTEKNTMSEGKSWLGKHWTSEIVTQKDDVKEKRFGEEENYRNSHIADEKSDHGPQLVFWDKSPNAEKIWKGRYEGATVGSKEIENTKRKRRIIRRILNNGLIRKNYGIPVENHITKIMKELALQKGETKRFKKTNQIIEFGKSTGYTYESSNAKKERIESFVEDEEGKRPKEVSESEKKIYENVFSVQPMLTGKEESKKSIEKEFEEKREIKEREDGISEENHIFLRKGERKHQNKNDKNGLKAQTEEKGDGIFDVRSWSSRSNEGKQLNSGIQRETILKEKRLFKESSKSKKNIGGKSVEERKRKNRNGTQKTRKRTKKIKFRNEFSKGHFLNPNKEANIGFTSIENNKKKKLIIRIEGYGTFEIEDSGERIKRKRRGKKKFSKGKKLAKKRLKMTSFERLGNYPTYDISKEITTSSERLLIVKVKRAEKEAEVNKSKKKRKKSEPMIKSLKIKPSDKRSNYPKHDTSEEITMSILRIFTGKSMEASKEPREKKSKKKKKKFKPAKRRLKIKPYRPDNYP